MKRPYLIPMAVLCCAGIAYAAGSISVTGYPAVPRTLKGGTGINIAPDGTFSATGDAVANGTQPFANLSSALRGKYLPIAGTAVNSANAQAYKGNSAPSATEFSYLQGVTSAIQGQIDGKAATSSIALVGTTGQYNDLSGKPTIPSALSDLSGDSTHRTVTDTEKSTWNGKQAALGYTAENAANKGTANGYPSLDSGGKIPSAQIPTLNQNTTGTAAGLTAQYIDWSLTSGGASIKNKPTLSTVAASGNYSDLNGKPAPYTLPTASTIVKGGVLIDGSSIQIDGSGVIHSTVSAGVSSVNGYTGDIDLQTTDIVGFGNYSSSVKSRLAGKMDSVNPTYTGTLTTSNADGTHWSYDYNTASCPSGVDEGAKCTLPSGIWWYKSGAWTQAGLLPAYTLSPATASVIGGVKPGTALSVDSNGVLSVMLNSLGPSGLVTAGLSGDATIRKGFAYVAASSGTWTFANYSSGTTTVFTNYTATIVSATSGGLNIVNPITFANHTSSRAKIYAGTYATIQSKGDGKYWVTSNRNLTKQTGAASGTGGGGGGSGTAAWHYSTTTDSVEVLITNPPVFLGAHVAIGTDTSITALASKVSYTYQATACKLAMYDTATPSNLLASGTCTPVAGQWCVAPVTYTGSASSTYRVVTECNGGYGLYGMLSSTSGINGVSASYAAFPVTNQAWDETNWDKRASVAVCTGGTCGGLR